MSTYKKVSRKKSIRKRSKSSSRKKSLKSSMNNKYERELTHFLEIFSFSSFELALATESWMIFLAVSKNFFSSNCTKGIKMSDSYIVFGAFSFGHRE